MTAQAERDARERSSSPDSDDSGPIGYDSLGVHLILGYQDPDNIMTPAIPVRGLPPRTLPLNSLPSIDVVTKKAFELWENTLASRGLTEDDIVKFTFSFTDGEGVRRKIAIGRSNRTFTRAIAQVARYAIIVTDTDARWSCGSCNGEFHPPWLMVAFGTLDKTGKLTHDDMITLKDLESHTKPVDALVEEEQTMLWAAQSIVDLEQDYLFKNKNAERQKWELLDLRNEMRSLKIQLASVNADRKDLATQLQAATGKSPAFNDKNDVLAIAPNSKHNAVAKMQARYLQTSPSTVVGIPPEDILRFSNDEPALSPRDSAQLLNTRASPSSEPTTPRTTKVINGSQPQDPSQSAEEAHLNDLNALLNSEHEITANKTASEIVQNEIGSPTPRCRNAAPQQPRTRSRSQPTKRSFGDMHGPGTSSSDKH